MTIEEAIVSELASLASAHPLIQPAGFKGLCVVYQLVGDPPTHLNRYVEPRVQLACWADSYAAAVGLETQVWDLFEGRHVTVDGLHYRSMVIDRRDGQPDLDLGRFCRIVDVRFFYRK
ncbi:MAG: hypothetical protein GX113_04235 [Actinobacteria bacterium]|jgi:hypothetical protein|nr:hypothetical protein [Actinomycetota bacterium]